MNASPSPSYPPPPQQDYYNIQSRGQQQVPPPPQYAPPPPPSQQYQQQPHYQQTPLQQPYYPPAPQQQPQPSFQQPQPYHQQHQPSTTNNNSSNSFASNNTASLYPQQVQPTASPNTYQRPPYVDPETHIVHDCSNAEYEGWLTKQSAWLKEWRRRYFILKGSKLFFAKNEYGAPHGMMDLAHCTTVKSADLKSKKRHSFEISTPDTQYLLYADTESQKDDWIGRVGKAIVRCSRTYYGQGQGPDQQQRQQQAASDMAQQEVYQYNEEDDDIYTNDDPNNPYFND